MIYNDNRDKDEYNHKESYCKNIRLEEITIRLFSKWNFVKVDDEERNAFVRYDFILSRGRKEYAVDVKYYRNFKVNPHNLYFNLSYLDKINSNVSLGKAGRVNMLVIYGVITEALRKKIQNNYKIVILDLSNILYMAAIDENIESEIKLLLDYSVADVLPVAPVGINLNKMLLENKRKDSKLVSKSDELISAISSWKPEKNCYMNYESLCIETLKYLFNDELVMWREQERTHDSLYRYDLVCRIKDGSVSGFWKTIENFFNSKYIIFQFKNYRDKITQGEIYTTEKYLYLKALRGVAIIISCYGANPNAEKAIRGALRENGKLILSIDNKGLIEMLEYKDRGEEPSVYLYNKLDDMLVDLEK